MESINNNNQLYIRILTPTFIGAGSEKNWSEGIDYFYKNKTVYILDKQKIFHKLINDKQAIDIWTNLIAGGKSADFLKYLTTKGIDFEEISVYKFNASQAPKDDIKAFIRTGLGVPIIPGSSLKGAIKSVLFDYLNKEVQPENMIKFTDNKTGQPVKYDKKEYDKILFGDINNNLMRLIRITDAEFEDSGLFTTKTYNLMNNGKNWETAWKFAGGKGNNDVKFEKEGFVFTYEILEPDATSTFRLGFAEEIFKLLFNAPKNKPKYADKVLTTNPCNHLFRIINEHTKAYINKETIFYKRFENEENAGHIEVIISKLNGLLKEIPEDNLSCVLHLGAGSGFHGITGDWQFEHIETVIKPENDKRYKSRKLAFEPHNDGYSFYPMGFMKIMDTSTWNKEFAGKAEKDKLKKAEKERLQLIELQKIEEEKQKAEEAKKPHNKDFSKLKSNDIIDAIVLRQEGNYVVVDLFCENLPQKVQKFRYASGFEKDEILELIVTFPMKENRNQFNLQYKKKK